MYFYGLRNYGAYFVHRVVLFSAGVLSNNKCNSVAKLGKKVEEAIFGNGKVQFFSGSSVQFLLNVHYFGV